MNDDIEHKTPFFSAAFSGRTWVLADAYYDIVRRLRKLEELAGIKAGDADERRPVE